MTKRNQTGNRNGERGFTLLELLAVLMLLAFILAMVAPNVIKNLQDGQIKAAKAQVKATQNVLNLYYMDNSTYPTTEQGLKALLQKPSTPPIPENWNGPYIDGSSLPKDPWGSELQYKCPGDKNPQSYDIYSFGKDKAPGGTGQNADIGNW